MTSPSPGPANARRHDIDALRVCAFGLLILFHVGMFYVPWDWHVNSQHVAGWLDLPMALSHQFRMQLVFLVSGLALNFLRRRTRDGQLARSRVTRLALPLLFGMAVIIPPQAYLEALRHGTTEPGYVLPVALFHAPALARWNRSCERMVPDHGSSRTPYES